jgi:hypothetical protein
LRRKVVRQRRRLNSDGTGHPTSNAKSGLWFPVVDGLDFDLLTMPGDPNRSRASDKPDYEPRCAFRPNVITDSDGS